MRRKWRALVALILGAPLALACAHLNGEREACYASADANELREAYDQCPAKWSTCPARPSIMAEHAAAMRRCP